MNRKYRLTRSDDIQRVRRTGKSFAHPLLVLIVENSDSPEPFQAAFLASKSIGGAVSRNRAKRRMRSAFEGYANRVRPGVNLLVVARKAILEAKFRDVLAALAQTMEKARILGENDGTG